MITNSKKETASQDGMTNKTTLVNEAYTDAEKLKRRKDIYKYTHPNYPIETEVLTLLNLHGGENVLDAGCGTGKLILQGAEQFPQTNFVGADLSSGVFSEASLKSQKSLQNARFLAADIQQLPFANASYDRVTAMHMLYHAPDVHKALTELARVVKTTGIVLVTANSKESRKQLGHLKTQAAALMQRPVFTDPNIRFNLEIGQTMIGQYFAHVALVEFPSTLKLDKTSGSQPYLDYFDSLKHFWQPIPSDAQWEAVMNATKNYVENEIKTKGAFVDTVGFGAIIASHQALPSEIILRSKKK